MSMSTTLGDFCMYEPPEVWMKIQHVVSVFYILMCPGGGVSDRVGWDWDRVGEGGYSIYTWKTICKSLYGRTT